MFSSPPVAGHWPGAACTSVFLLPLLCGFAATAPVAQAGAFSSPDGLWTPAEQVQLPQRFSPPTEFAASRLDLSGFLSALVAAPSGTTGPGGSPARVYLPLPNGELVEIAVKQSGEIERELAALFPELQTFEFESSPDRGISGSVAVGPGGVYVLAQGPNQMLRVEPVQTDEGVLYLSYFNRNRTEREGRHELEMTRDTQGACGETGTQIASSDRGNQDGLRTALERLTQPAR